jgi:hypothetical protein
MRILGLLGWRGLGRVKFWPRISQACLVVSWKQIGVPGVVLFDWIKGYHKINKDNARIAIHCFFNFGARFLAQQFRQKSDILA